jgi:polysaccharide deacetylase 2 family uncharacterized protein YibQ
MGTSKFLRNASIAFIVLGVALVSTKLFKNPTKHVDANKTLKLQKKAETNISDISKTLENFEENKTLDGKYKSVAFEIEAFIKKQKVKKPPKEPIPLDTTEQNITTKKEQNITAVDIEVKKVEKKKPKKMVKKPTKSKTKKKSSHVSMPKLVIIMDDVGFYDDIEKIKQIPLSITPSIFPPNAHYPKTAQIAKKFKHYMVHLPMEAYNYKNMAEEAIQVSDKIEILEKKIKKMHQSFPNAKAINNHTGSKYTCDFDAMEEFFIVLNRYKIPFIDSRTSSGSQCKEVGKLLHNKVLERDVFLDNKADVNYIRGQLKKAVSIAKKRGKAIAICHPRDLTIEVLKDCKDILKGVKVVYIDELL